MTHYKKQLQKALDDLKHQKEIVEGLKIRIKSLKKLLDTTKKT